MEKLPELNYQSFLADAMRDYLDYLDHLGFSIVGPAYNLRRIDRFLAENHVACTQHCDSRLWLRLVAQYQGRVKANTLQGWRQTFHGLCRYLVRQGWMLENPVTAFTVPKPQHYRPYVFSPDELHRLFDLLQQQAASSFGVMIIAVGLDIRSDVRFHQKSSANIVHPNISFCEADLTGTNGFDFATFQGKPSLKPFKEKVFKASFAIGGNRFDMFRHRGTLNYCNMVVQGSEPFSPILR